MGKDLGNKSCETCTHEKEGKCFYPPIAKTYPNGRDCKEARQPGRFCGPSGTMFRMAVQR